MGRKRLYRFLRSERRDRTLTLVGLSVGLLFFLCLLTLISYYMFTLARLELEYNLEKGLNNVILAIQDESISIDRTMEENNIIGVGVYTSYGNLLYSKGRVYSRLPITQFDFAGRGNSNNSIINYDSSRKIMEYIRFSKQAVIPTTQNLLLPIGGEIIDFSNMIYIAYDATEYDNQILELRVITFFAFAFVLVTFYAIIRIYNQNRKYKEMLRSQENLVSLGQAARTLTHEIKNPLSAITIQLALLKRSVPKENLEDLAVIENETKRVIQLTNKVSDFLRNPQGQPVRIDLVESIGALIPLFAAPIRWVEGSEKSAYVMFDGDRLRSIFENILKNAIEATPEGGECDVEVEVTKARKAGCYAVYVRDRGVGIKDEDAKKIFDPFFTTKIHGSGIGLSISMKFVEAAGGTLRLKKREGGGTVVEVVIPAAKEAEKYESADL